MKLSRLFTILISIIATCGHADAEMRVSLITCEPGTDVYELEGHTALRFVDTDDATDFTVNWGIFDFNSPGFVYRFVKGETDYMAGKLPTPLFLDTYLREGRRVTEQQLNLSPDQVDKLIELVEINLLPENSSYRYKYLTDNCATRPLALIEQAIGRPLADGKAVTTTWRKEMRRYHKNYPWYQFGIDLALGSRLDDNISSRECAFAPLYLRDYVTAAGLTSGTIELIPSRQFGLPYGPTPALLTPMAVAIYVLLISIAITILMKKYPNIYKSYTSLFFLINTLAGALIMFLVFVSEHEATSPNWLLLWLNPLSIIPTAGIWLKKLNRAVFYYQIVNFVFLIVLLIIFAIGVQSPNPAFLPLIMSDMILAASYIWSKRCILSRHRR